MAALDAAIAAPDSGLYYGRRGTPTIWALEEALSALEPGAAGTKLYPSGVAAIATALLALLSPGDHLLMVDSVYEPTRAYCDRTLARMGIATTYYDPLIGAGIEALVQDTTRVIFLESPGSLTFEVQDVPAITRVARACGIATVLDNTWATPLLFPALAHGVDVAMQSLTKWVVGHSDALLGSLTANEAYWPRIARQTYQLGQRAGGDEAALALRGLRTLDVRMQRHGDNALAVARWLATQPRVDRGLHPALDSCPGHALFARDFAGAAGLFGFTLKTGSRADLAPLIDGLKHFGMGFSWGGYESLILPANLNGLRTATHWDAPGPLLRLHIGLEDPADLIADLDAGLARLGQGPNHRQ